MMKLPTTILQEVMPLVLSDLSTIREIMPKVQKNKHNSWRIVSEYV